MIEARLRHQYAYAPTPGPKTEQPLANPPSAPAKNGSAALRTALSSLLPFWSAQHAPPAVSHRQVPLSSAPA